MPFIVLPVIVCFLGETKCGEGVRDTKVNIYVKSHASVQTIVVANKAPNTREMEIREPSEWLHGKNGRKQVLSLL